MRKINVGLIGFGTIGSGVVEVLRKRRALLKQKGGVDVAIKKICDKDLKRRRPVKVKRSILTKAIGDILYDPEIDIVVELIGGIRPAKDIILGAIRQGKHVVTANKALLAEAGREIFDLANECGVTIRYEGSVGGGIPIIRALREGFIANKVDLIYGIINGTSNFILTNMSEEGVEFRASLDMAKKKGYAEKSPHLDISGMDSTHKLAILALLGFGLPVKPRHIYTEGIENIEQGDIQYSAELGYSIKLLAIAKRAQDELELRVHPTLIPKTHLLAGVNGIYNAIYVKGDLLGESLFYGKGAGKYPTSSSVAGDIMSIAKDISIGLGRVSNIGFKRVVKRAKSFGDIRTRYYIRFSAIDKPGVLARISGILGRRGISIASVTQKERERAKVVPIVMMTHKARESSMQVALKEIDRLGIIKKKSVRIRIED